ncbi:MAG: PilZ domain-containing protein [Deltaproteobacteria bacterium]|nr:PilZ domain-containing protein [Deltaproteobacteria bacterium]
MADHDEYSSSNSIILALMERILSMNDEQRLDLLGKLEELPAENLSLGDRDGVRKNFDKNITFSVQDRSYNALCKDISNGGLFIQTDEVFSVGQTVVLSIPFSDGNREIKVPAEIVRVSRQGIGLRFMKKENDDI